MATSEAVGAVEARMPFRFPREAALVLLALAVVWQIVSFFVPPFVVPGLDRICKSLAALRYDFVLVTLARVVAALLISFALGMALAVAMYLWPSIERHLRPVVRLLMAVPAVCSI